MDFYSKIFTSKSKKRFFDDSLISQKMGMFNFVVTLHTNQIKCAWTNTVVLGGLRFDPTKIEKSLKLELPYWPQFRCHKKMVTSSLQIKILFRFQSVNL